MTDHWSNTESFFDYDFYQGRVNEGQHYQVRISWVFFKYIFDLLHGIQRPGYIGINEIIFMSGGCLLSYLLPITRNSH